MSRLDKEQYSMQAHNHDQGRIGLELSPTKLHEKSLPLLWQCELSKLPSAYVQRMLHHPHIHSQRIVSSCFQMICMNSATSYKLRYTHTEKYMYMHVKCTCTCTCTGISMHTQIYVYILICYKSYVVHTDTICQNSSAVNTSFTKKLGKSVVQLNWAS